MQIEITVADDRLSAVVGEDMIKVNDIISFKNVDEKMVGATIMNFAVIDKKDMKSPWMYVQENATGATDWISIHNWLDLKLPSQSKFYPDGEFEAGAEEPEAPKAAPKKAAPAPKVVTPVLTDEDDDDDLPF